MTGSARSLLVAIVALMLVSAACTSATSGTATEAASSSAVPPPPTVTVTATAATPSISAPPSFATIFGRERSGVVRIETVGCSDAGIGTGFLLSRRLIATVAHVVDESVVVSLIAGRQRTTGSVIGIDRSSDLALVRSAVPLVGFHFTLAGRQPSVGDEVAAVGFPIGDPITFTRGNVSGLHRNVSVEGIPRTGLIETDAAINPGNSGGPLVGSDGDVVGLVDAKNTDASGIGYAVPATEAANRVDTWRNSDSPVASANCPNPLGPSQASADVPSPGGIDNRTASGLAAAFDTYFDGINSGDYTAAYSVLSPNLQQQTSYRQFSQGDATTYDSEIQVLDARKLNSTTVQVALSFVSLQRADKGPNGDTCDVWTIQYTLVRGADGGWLIDASAPYGGTLSTSC